MEGIPRSRGRHSRRWREVIRPQCLRRDMAAQAPCWICGQPIDYTAAPGTPDAWEPDHYYPVKDYPELAEDPANIRPSHSSCNRSRHTGEHDGDIGEPSRRW